MCLGEGNNRDGCIFVNGPLCFERVIRIYRVELVSLSFVIYPTRLLFWFDLSLELAFEKSFI